MDNYYISKIIENQGVYRPDCIVIGDVEIRPPKKDISNELEAIKESIKKNHSLIDPEINCRMGTIVEAISMKDAELRADEKFLEIIDILNSEFVVSNIRLSKCGYIKNLENGELKILEKMSPNPSTSFIVRQSTIEKFEISQWIAQQNSELANRYKRSLHWSRNAKWERNLQLRILFNWFSVEALFKESEHDNVGGLIRWFLGYPNGRFAADVSDKLLNQLRSNPLYDNWKTKIKNSIEDIRIFRNNSVHSGFRNVDFPVSEIRLYNQLMDSGRFRCQRAVLKALTSRIESASEFKEYLSVIFENIYNLVNDIHNNVLYSLENKPLDIFFENVYG